MLWTNYKQLAFRRGEIIWIVLLYTHVPHPRFSLSPLTETDYNRKSSPFQTNVLLCWGQLYLKQCDNISSRCNQIITSWIKMLSRQTITWKPIKRLPPYSTFSSLSILSTLSVVFPCAHLLFHFPIPFSVLCLHLHSQFTLLPPPLLLYSPILPSLCLLFPSPQLRATATE